MLISDDITSTNLMYDGTLFSILSFERPRSPINISIAPETQAFYINFEEVPHQKYIEKLIDAQLDDIDNTCTAMVCTHHWHMHGEDND